MVTRLDHDANVRPWVQAAEAVGATVRWVDFDRDDRRAAPPRTSRRVLSERTRLVAVTGASNLLGTRPDLPAIAGLVHDAGALLYVDGVHLDPARRRSTSPPSAPTSYACSPYKFFGPHCGVLAAAPELLETLQPDKLLPSTDAVPERFELGTLPYELMAGTTAAVDFLAGLRPRRRARRRERLLASMAAVEAHEDALRERPRVAAWPASTASTAARPRRRAHADPAASPSPGRDAGRLSPSSWPSAGSTRRPARSTPSRPSRWLGLGDAGGLRVGLAPYTDDADVDRLVRAVEHAGGDVGPASGSARHPGPAAARAGPLAKLPDSG